MKNPFKRTPQKITHVLELERQTVSPITVNHVVKHEPYPKPNQLKVTFMAFDGREFILPPMYVTNGVMRIENVPRPYDENGWHSIRVEFYYGA